MAASNQTLLRIITLCREIDRKAEAIYSGFSESTEDKRLRSFWKGMAGEEHQHVGYWTCLLDCKTIEHYGRVFEHPENVESELAESNRRAHELLPEAGKSRALTEQLLIAYRTSVHCKGSSRSARTAKTSATTQATGKRSRPTCPTTLKP